MAKKKSEKPKDNIKRVPFTCSLKVMLAADEIADRADRAAHKLASIQDKEAELKALSTHHKSIIQTEEAELSLLSKEVRDKSMYRQIDCERQYDFNAGMYREVRNDSGEIFMERKLLESEKQMELPFDDGADDGDKHDPNKKPKAGASGPVAPVSPEASADETWKPIPIVEALPTLGKKIFDGMAKLNLHTMGELMAWKFGVVERFWTDIDGLGEAGCTKIDDAIAAFFAGRNKPAA